jgi:hypothetical protein
MQSFAQAPYRVSANVSVGRLLPNDEAYTDYALKLEKAHFRTLRRLPRHACCDSSCIIFVIRNFRPVVLFLYDY